MPVDYQRAMEARIAALGGEIPALALHSCCAVCSSSVLETLSRHFRVTVFYCNPNIFPREEYEKRKAEQIRLIRSVVYPNPVDFTEDPYEHALFLEASRGLEGEPEGGARCARCFALRLGRTAAFAAARGIGLVASTLTVSPHKNAALVNAAGEAAAREHGLEWLPADFKKKNGYLRSTRIARELGLYRQRTCGCEFESDRKQQRFPSD